MDNMSEEKLEEISARAKASDMLLDMLCKITGDKQILFYKKQSDFNNKLANLAMLKNVTTEQYEKLIQLVKQFDNIVDDFIKEENIKIEEKII